MDWFNRILTSRKPWEELEAEILECGDSEIDELDIFDAFVMRYGWQRPTVNAINACVSESPIIELGAGKGYWAFRINEAGGIITAFDTGKWYGFEDLWYPVKPVPTGGVIVPKEYTLFLCWPTYGQDWSENALLDYEGSTVIHIGPDNCPDGLHFQSILESKWALDKEVPLSPNTDSSISPYDHLCVYRR